jgi:hypothetical protein
MVQDYDTGGTFRSLGTRTDTGTLFGRTMGLVAVTVGLFTLGAYLARTLSGGWAMAFWIASFVCLLAMNVTMRQSEQLTLGLLFGIDLLVGLATPIGRWVTKRVMNRVRRKGEAMGMGVNALVLTTIGCTSGRERNAVASMGGRDPR